MSTRRTPAEKVLAAIAKTPGLGRVAYAKATKLETPVVGRAFQVLKAEKLIVQKGDKRGATYELKVTRTTAKKSTPQPKKAAPVKAETPKAPAKRVRTKKADPVAVATPEVPKTEE